MMLFQRISEMAGLSDLWHRACPLRGQSLVFAVALWLMVNSVPNAAGHDDHEHRNVLGPCASRVNCTEADLSNTPYGYGRNMDIGGLFPIFAWDGQNQVCNEVVQEKGYQRMEAMRYAVGLVNKNPSVLYDLQLSYHIGDTCGNSLHAIVESLMPMLNLQNAVCEEEEEEAESQPAIGMRRTGEDSSSSFTVRTAAVVGAASSSVSTAIAGMLRPFRVTQVSYASTSDSLSNDHDFPYFMRTVSPDFFQARVMVDLASHFNWTFVKLIYSDDLYGRGGAEGFQSLCSLKGVCVAETAELETHSESGDATYNSALDMLFNDDRYPKRRARVVIVFAAKVTFRKLLRLSNQHPKASNHSYVWIASDSTGEDASLAQEAPDLVDGMFTVIPFAPLLPGFDEYFFNLKPDEPWRSQYLAEKLGCDPNAVTGSRTACDAKSMLPSVYSQNNKVPFVVDAVFAVAQGLHALLCTDTTRSCRLPGSVENLSTKLSIYLKSNGTMLTDANGQPMRFSANGDPALPRYRISNLVIDGTPRFKSVAEWHRGGGGQNLFFTSPISWPREYSGPPMSTCSDPCARGEYELRGAGRLGACCWTCVACVDQTAVNVSGSECIPCASDEIAVDNNTICEGLPLRWPGTSPAFFVNSAFSSMLSFTALLVYTIVWCWKERETKTKTDHEKEKYHHKLLQPGFTIFLLVVVWLFVFSGSFEYFLPPSAITCPTVLAIHLAFSALALTPITAGVIVFAHNYDIIHLDNKFIVETLREHKEALEQELDELAEESGEDDEEDEECDTFNESPLSTNQANLTVENDNGSLFTDEGLSNGQQGMDTDTPPETNRVLPRTEGTTVSSLTASLSSIATSKSYSIFNGTESRDFSLQDSQSLPGLGQSMTEARGALSPSDIARDRYQRGSTLSGRSFELPVPSIMVEPPKKGQLRSAHAKRLLEHRLSAIKSSDESSDSLSRLSASSVMAVVDDRLAVPPSPYAANAEGETADTDTKTCGESSSPWCDSNPVDVFLNDSEAEIGGIEAGSSQQDLAAAVTASVEPLTKPVLLGFSAGSAEGAVFNAESECDISMNNAASPEVEVPEKAEVFPAKPEDSCPVPEFTKTDRQKVSIKAEDTRSSTSLKILQAKSFDDRDTPMSLSSGGSLRGSLKTTAANPRRNLRRQAMIRMETESESSAQRARRTSSLPRDSVGSPASIVRNSGKRSSGRSTRSSQSGEARRRASRSVARRKTSGASMTMAPLRGNVVRLSLNKDSDSPPPTPAPLRPGQMSITSLRLLKKQQSRSRTLSTVPASTSQDGDGASNVSDNVSVASSKAALSTKGSIASLLAPQTAVASVFSFSVESIATNLSPQIIAPISVVICTAVVGYFGATSGFQRYVVPHQSVYGYCASLGGTGSMLLVVAVLSVICGVCVARTQHCYSENAKLKEELKNYAYETDSFTFPPDVHPSSFRHMRLVPTWLKLALAAHLLMFVVNCLEFVVRFTIGNSPELYVHTRHACIPLRYFVLVGCMMWPLKNHIVPTFRNLGRTIKGKLVGPDRFRPSGALRSLRTRLRERRARQAVTTQPEASTQRPDAETLLPAQESVTSDSVCVSSAQPLRPARQQTPPGGARDPSLKTARSAGIHPSPKRVAFASPPTVTSAGLKGKKMVFTFSFSTETQKSCSESNIPVSVSEDREVPAIATRCKSEINLSVTEQHAPVTPRVTEGVTLQPAKPYPLARQPQVESTSSLMPAAQSEANSPGGGEEENTPTIEQDAPMQCQPATSQSSLAVPDASEEPVKPMPYTGHEASRKARLSKSAMDLFLGGQSDQPAGQTKLGELQKPLVTRSAGNLLELVKLPPLLPDKSKPQSLHSLL